MFAREFPELGIAVYQLFFQAIRGCDVHFVHFSFQSDAWSGQDGGGGKRSLGPPLSYLARKNVSRTTLTNASGQFALVGAKFRSNPATSRPRLRSDRNSNLNASQWPENHTYDRAPGPRNFHHAPQEKPSLRAFHGPRREHVPAASRRNH